ncbi:hypothetical protein DFQ27_008470 [Actinomortierella ambigua]|uniref:Saccharopine dehydrogenase NADP binding domain-containing protein n=1 Tax=Actinomortierella ambigua TaxID=1343610 RepID=A0A9P6QFU9_9FUNG|nr:hypothetical protein DFQ27_008470 [Actinomortierella ambigua]
MAAREFELIIYGATGFTGLRTALSLRWAIAGRSIEKLEQAREQVAAINPAFKDLPIIKADASSPESLSAMVSKTKVVLSTVGPFLQYGEPLVAACVRHGTHYVDSTGETPFVNNMIRKYHDEAKAKKVVIVPQCGFDSVPSDIGTKLVVDYLRKEYGLATKSVKMSVTKLKGAVSGGTLASVCGILESREGGVGNIVDQNQLVPDDVKAKVPAARITSPSVFYDYDFKKWQAYFLMSSTNEKIVKRSHGLALEADGVGYGHQFSYSETMSCPGFGSALVASVGMGLGGAALSVGPIRRLAQKYVLPAPGTGPSDESIAKGYFTIEVVGEAELPENAVEEAEAGEQRKVVRAKATVSGSEPGYSETCRLLVESAMCLIKEEERTFRENKIQGGLLTPASAFGHVLVQRLQERGVVLEVAKL